MRKVDIVASGYEWMCPDCETSVSIRTSEIVEGIVECPCCGAEFEMNPSEDTFGD